MKKLLIFVLLLFVSGCTPSYDITVTADKKIEEELTLTIDKEVILESTSDIKEYMKNQIESYQKTSMFRGYEMSYKIKKDVVLVTISKTHPNFESYENSYIIKEVFDGVYRIDGKNYFVSTIGDYKPLGANSHEPEYETADLKVTVKFHNKVLSSNADIEDEKKNVYTWTLKPTDVKRYIEFNLSNEKRYDIIILDYISDNIYAIVPLTVLLLGLGTAGIVILSRYKSNNRI